MDRKNRIPRQEEPKQYGNESFGIPSDCTKKQKMSGVKLFCYIVVVFLLCGIIYGSYRTFTDYWLPEMTFDKSAQPMLYVKNSEIMLKQKSDLRGNSFTEENALYNTTSAPFAKITEDGKYLFYLGQKTKDLAGYDFFYRMVSSVDGENDFEQETVYIDGGVTAFKVASKGKAVLYSKLGWLYYSDLNSSRIIATDVTDFYLSDNNQQIIYFKDGGKMYTCGTSKNDAPVLVDDGIEKLISEKDEYAEIYYLKKGALYRKAKDAKESVCIHESVLDAIMLDEYVYFVTQEERPVRFKEIFSDPFSVTDAELVAPTKKAFLKEDETGASYVDEEAFLLAREAYEQKLLRDSVRDYFLTNPITRTENVLYVVKRDEVKELDTGLTEAYLRYHSSRRVIVYKKRVEEAEKIDITTITSIREAKERAEKRSVNYVGDSMQVLVKDKNPYPGLSEYPSGQIELSLDGKYLYAVEDGDANGRGNLVRYSIGARKLYDKAVLLKGVTDFALDGADSLVVLAFDGDALGICMDTDYTHLADRSCRSFFYVDHTLYFYDDYQPQNETGDLKYFRNGKVRYIDTGVHAFDVRNLKTVAYIKHYNKTLGIGDLYIKNGSRRGRKTDICVSRILY